MKISRRNRQCLNFLINENLHGIQLPNCKFRGEINGEFLNSIFKEKIKAFKSNIYILSRSFARVQESSIDKLLKIENFKDLSGAKGSIIYNKSLFCYEIKQVSGIMKCSIFVIAENNLIGVYITEDLIESLNGNATKGFRYLAYNLPIELQDLCATVYIFELFKRYAETDTKLLPAKSKTSLFNCKYVNDIPLDLTIMDSRYFTNIFQENGFKVRGHFRMQRVGKGRSDKKIIWINEFEKKGYAIKATIDK